MAIHADFPALAEIAGFRGPPPSEVPGVSPGAEGLCVPIGEVAKSLSELPPHRVVTDSLRVYAATALLALDLAARQLAIPSVYNHEARWRALLAHPNDRERVTMLAKALPAVARAPGQRPEGAIRAVLDATIDALFRRNAWPGPGRGWSLELAEALRGPEAGFRTRDARFHGVAEQLDAWAEEAESADLRFGIRLELPKGDSSGFGVRLLLHPPGDAHPIDLEQDWGRGFPVWVAVRGLARAARLFPPLAPALAGPVPKHLTWTADETWAFLDKGVPALREAGVEVTLPPEFAPTGRQRLRTRLCIGVPTGIDVEATTPCPCRWEVTLGERILSTPEVDQLRAANRPILRFAGQWVLIEAADLARLPAGPKNLLLPAHEALGAVLSGTWNGAPTTADHDLGALIELLRHPPEVAAPAGLHATLRPYQARGVAWLAAMGRLGLGACLADDMGLGKTVQLVGHLLHRKGRAADRRPSLVVCPTSVLGNWVRELRRFAPDLSVMRHHGLGRREDLKALRHADVVLTTYGLLVRDVDLLEAQKWDVVALDEAQSIKNPDSQRAICARKLQARHRVAMSGTPVENRLDELWSLMQFIAPGVLGPRARFREQVAIPVEKFGDKAAAGKLRATVAPFLLRRVKSDPEIAPDLPEKFEQRQYCPLTSEQAKLYKQIVEEQMELVAEASLQERRGRVLAMLTHLKQACNHPIQVLHDGGPLQGRSGKMERCTDLVSAIVAQGARTLIFTQYVQMGELLCKRLGEVLGRPVPFLHGGVSATNRDEMVRDFQENPNAPWVLVISLRAGGTGLNLTRATHVIHYDRWWNPAVEDQATDRAHRIGQRLDVNVHKLICHDTLEERIDALLEEKRALADQVVGSGEGLVASLDDDALRRLVALGSEAVVE